MSSTNARPEDQPGDPGDDPALTPLPQAPDLRTVPWRAFLGYFLGLGTWGFGGPIASVGYSNATWWSAAPGSAAPTSSTGSR